MNPRLNWLLAGAVVLAAALYLGRNLILGTPVRTVTAARGPLVQTVVASGRIITPQRVAIGATITERVARIPVDEGQTVKKGEVLIALDDSDERAALAQAQAALVQAEAKMRQMRELALPAAEQALEQAQANAVQARLSYERTEALRKQGFVGQAQLDDARRTLDVAESQLRAARLQVETSRPSGSDFALARAALEQARANVAAAQAKLAQTVIIAPADGVLITRNVEPGDVVQPGKELMALAPAGETQIVVQIDEKNLGLLAVGQKAIASADAYPAQRFAAEVFYINPGVDPLRGAVEVKLKVPDPPAFLRQDMTVSVDIEVARRADALVVPSEAVHDATGAHPWVLAVNGMHAVRRPVTLGLRGDGRIEVLAGVAPGDRLIASDQPVLPGQRVRAVQ
ncbi:MAG: efflux RND transporter periplasmic adaptor subunit [Sphingomonadaceae bacterium]